MFRKLLLKLATLSYAQNIEPATSAHISSLVYGCDVSPLKYADCNASSHTHLRTVCARYSVLFTFIPAPHNNLNSPQAVFISFAGVMNILSTFHFPQLRTALPACLRKLAIPLFLGITFCICSLTVTAFSTLAVFFITVEAVLATFATSSTLSTNLTPAFTRPGALVANHNPFAHTTLATISSTPE
jgi:hypothetical protein